MSTPLFPPPQPQSFLLPTPQSMASLQLPGLPTNPAAAMQIPQFNAQTFQQAAMLPLVPLMAPAMAIQNLIQRK